MEHSLVGEGVKGDPRHNQAAWWSLRLVVQGVGGLGSKLRRILLGSQYLPPMTTTNMVKGGPFDYFNLCLKTRYSAGSVRPSTNRFQRPPALTVVQQLQQTVQNRARCRRQLLGSRMLEHPAAVSCRGWHGEQNDGAAATAERGGWRSLPAMRGSQAALNE